MAPRAAPLPEPVLDTDGDVAMFSGEIAASLRNGQGLQGCVVCLVGTMVRWPLDELAAAIEHEPDRTVDANGTPYSYRRVAPDSWTAPVALHHQCAPGVLTAWALMVHDGEGPVREDEPVAATRPASGAARRQGAYGRRRSS